LKLSHSNLYLSPYDLNSAVTGKSKLEFLQNHTTCDTTNLSFAITVAIFVLLEKKSYSVRPLSSRHFLELHLCAGFFTT
jgi:hypothetical protein